MNTTLNFRTSVRFDLDCSLLRVVSIGVLSLSPTTGQNARGTFGLGQKDRKFGSLIGTDSIFSRKNFPMETTNLFWRRGQQKDLN